MTKRTAPSRTTVLAFDDVDCPVALTDCSDLVDTVAGILSGWRYRELTATAPVEPAISICRTRTGYRRRSAWTPKAADLDDDVDAVRDLAARLVDRYQQHGAPLIRVRGAAVALEQGLVVLTSRSRRATGELAVHLTAAGARFFAGDRVLIDANGKAISPGVLPHLRLPLREHAGSRFDDFVGRHTGLQGKHGVFLRLAQDERSPLGTTAPISGVVFLRRDPAARPELFCVETADALKAVLAPGLAKGMPAVDTLDRLHKVVDGARCFTLRYNTGEDAVRLLQDEFGPEVAVPAARSGPPRKDDPWVGCERLYSQSHALVVGNANHTGGWRRLRTPVRDARRVADELAHRGFGVTLETDVTAKALRRALSEFVTENGADPDARLLFWFAGHGHKSDDGGYLVPSDAPPPFDAAFGTAALHLRELRDLVRRARSRHVLCVLDCCIDCSVFDPHQSPEPLQLSNRTKRVARQFITAGDAACDVADDGRFSAAFLRAVQGETAVADAGCLTASALGAFLSDCIQEITGGSQTPRYATLDDGSAGGGDFVFALPAHRPEHVTDSGSTP